MVESIAYTIPKIPADEKERLAELHNLGLLDTAAEARFDHYTGLIADIFNFPIVLVSLVDEHRQWFKSAWGLAARETPRDISFCAHAINQRGVFVVPDTHQDPRFAQNPLVTSDPGIRFYAGVVVHGPAGYPIGTLCVLDRKLREFSAKDRELLGRFAALVEREFKHIHELKQFRASLELHAHCDPLTALPNRRHLLNQLKSLTTDPSQEVAVLLFNVSSQRLINQSYGKDAGDHLLVQIAQRLNQCCPLAGTVARLQADEFVMTFPLPPQADPYLDALLADLRGSLAAPFSIAERAHFVTVKCGVSLFPKDASTPLELIERAASAIRLPRRSGQPLNIRFYNTSESVSLADRMDIASRMRGALEAGAFRLVYQPVISLQDGHMVSLEALIRWHDADLGELAPDQFIPIAEESDLIIAIGRWVLREVCEQLARWNQLGDWHIPVAINISATELMQPGFASQLLQCLNDMQIPHNLLGLEITETSIANDSPLVRKNVETLDNACIRLFIDDFGTGYSSLTYLQRLPVSCVKIDQTFVSGLPGKENDAILTQGIIRIAQGLKLKTVAEGVESQAQLQFLTEAGCDYAQGFMISAPLSPDQAYAQRGQRLLPNPAMINRHN